MVGWIKGEENVSATCVKVMFKGQRQKIRVPPRVAYVKKNRLFYNSVVCLGTPQGRKLMW